jgi:hypothetical protein
VFPAVNLAGRPVVDTNGACGSRGTHTSFADAGFLDAELTRTVS